MQLMVVLVELGSLMGFEIKKKVYGQ